MKTLKLILGIVSIALAALVGYQSSLLVELGLWLGDTAPGLAGIFLAACMLAAGIVSLAVKKGAVGGFIATALYFVGGIFGIANSETFPDLQLYSILAFIIGALILIATISLRKKAKKAAEAQITVSEVNN